MGESLRAPTWSGECEWRSVGAIRVSLEPLGQIEEKFGKQLPSPARRQGIDFMGASISRRLPKFSLFLPKEKQLVTFWLNLSDDFNFWKVENLLSLNSVLILTITKKLAAGVEALGDEEGVTSGRSLVRTLHLGRIDLHLLMAKGKGDKGQWTQVLPGFTGQLKTQREVILRRKDGFLQKPSCVCREPLTVRVF